MHEKFLLERINDIDEKSNTWAGWMRNVPDNTPLTMLNIPGTHQSLQTHRSAVTDNVRCQNRGVYSQLLDGIRFLDLRFDRWASDNEQHCLFAYHTLPMGYTLAAVMQSLKVFLKRFPSEVVFINVSIKGGNDGGRDAWNNDFQFFKDMFYHPSEESPRMGDLTLGQVRGKVICHDMLWKDPSRFRGRS